MQTLLNETRQDVKELKELVVSIDKNVSLSIQRMEAMDEEHKELKAKVVKHDDHIKFMNSLYKIITASAGVALFFVEVVPFVYKLLR